MKITIEARGKIVTIDDQDDDYSVDSIHETVKNALLAIWNKKDVDEIMQYQVSGGDKIDILRNILEVDDELRIGQHILNEIGTDQLYNINDNNFISTFKS